MNYYCEVCAKFVKTKSKHKLLKTNTHKESDKCKYMELTIENPNKDNVDEVFYAYIIQHNKQYDHYLFKYHFKFVFNENQYSTLIKSNLFNNITMISWKKISRERNCCF